MKKTILLFVLLLSVFNLVNAEDILQGKLFFVVKDLCLTEKGKPSLILFDRLTFNNDDTVTVEVLIENIKAVRKKSFAVKDYSVQEISSQIILSLDDQPYWLFSIGQDCWMAFNYEAGFIDGMEYGNRYGGAPVFYLVNENFLNDFEVVTQKEVIEYKKLIMGK